jgi:hypothetical protein
VLLAIAGEPTCRFILAHALAARIGMASPAFQESQTAPGISSLEKQDDSQEPIVIERFTTRAAFQNDGASHAGLEVVVNMLSQNDGLPVCLIGMPFPSSSNTQ